MPIIGCVVQVGRRLKVGSENKLYVVAGERNMRTAIQLGGLYANVGQTTRTVYDRIGDKDYRYKSGSGEWKVIVEGIPLGKLEDAHIHELLRERDDVEWDSASSNTEEFHFVNDIGDGKEAERIVRECLAEISSDLNVNSYTIGDDSDTTISKLERSGIRHAGTFDGDDTYWFRVRSFVARTDKRGKPYLIVNFVNNTRAHKSVFCWNWNTDYPKVDSLYVAVLEGEKGGDFISTPSHRCRRIYEEFEEVTEEIPVLEIDNEEGGWWTRDPRILDIDWVPPGNEYKEFLREQIEDKRKWRRNYERKKEAERLRRHRNSCLAWMIILAMLFGSCKTCIYDKPEGRLSEEATEEALENRRSNRDEDIVEFYEKQGDAGLVPFS